MGRVLAVDDANETLVILRKTLALMGHEVQTASDPEQALQLLATQRYDLVFLDIMMPKVDGLEICRRIRQGGPNSNAKVVIFSAKAERDLIKLARGFGADFYLGKPSNISKIQEITRRMIGG